ncbi:MAG: hypothetical protein GYA87_00470 [Christensenellaceae bacterium]|nr:hypothetical protein [Christensenellaceae bacterium]
MKNNINKLFNISILLILFLLTISILYPKLVELRINFSVQEKNTIENTNQEINNNISSLDIININTANLFELDKLPGVGEVTAKNIILERQIAPFSYIEDIMYVKGIGQAKFEKIKNLIKVK